MHTTRKMGDCSLYPTKDTWTSFSQNNTDGHTYSILFLYYLKMDQTDKMAVLAVALVGDDESLVEDDNKGK